MEFVEQQGAVPVPVVASPVAWATVAGMAGWQGRCSEGSA